MSFYIETYNFRKPVSNDDGKRLSDDVMGTNWPVVYLLHGNNELYIGETSDADGRMEQHLDPNGKFYSQRKKLNKVNIVFDTTFNKSAILDIEQSLIRLFKYEINSKDSSKKSKYFTKLQNGNRGQSSQHNYYKRAHYQQQVEQIWEDLIKLGLATNSYKDIVNDSIFKFSPYSTLTFEQNDVCLDILEKSIDSLFSQKEGHKDDDFTAVIQGSAGTGKTIVLLHMMSRVAEAMNSNVSPARDDLDPEFDEDYSIAMSSLNRFYKLTSRIRDYVVKYGELRIAYVAQMTSLRNTIKTALKSIDYLKAKDAIGPNDVVNGSKAGTDQFEKYDILFVDEAHRLWQRKSIPSMGPYDIACRKLYGDGVDLNSKTALDWLLDCSKTRVLIYDELQTVKDSDITPEQYKRALASRNPSKIKSYRLKQQMRCTGGIDYLKYLEEIFGCKSNLNQREIEQYDLKLITDPNELINLIVKRNEQFGLCRVVAGYGWQWNKKAYDTCDKLFNEEVRNGNIKDSRAAKVKFYSDLLDVNDGLIDFDGQQYVRNLDFDWIIQGDPHEIGCIHTSQGFDLNYVGVLFGPEIDYDEDQGIVIYQDKIKDGAINTSMRGLTVEEAQEKSKNISNYVLNAYKVMMSRGIKGCYVWAYNSGLQAYLAKYIDIK